MRYLVHARVRPGKEEKLLKAIEKGTLGRGSVAGHEYLHDMSRARLFTDGQVRWVEICFCDVPLAEERAYWEEFFELTEVRDAHSRRNCKDLNGTEPWACCSCDCTSELEKRLGDSGQSFLEHLKQAQSA